MKKVVYIIMTSLLMFTLISCSYENKKQIKQNDISNNKAAVNEISGKNTVTADVIFRAMDSNSKPLPGVKMLIINGNGEVIDTETSDNNGEAEKKLTVSIDKRYECTGQNKMEPRGTVTVIAFKEGYCKTVLFEVPVSPASAAQPFYMTPEVAGQRNEPVVQLGNNHHLEILSLVDKYSQYLNK